LKEIDKQNWEYAHRLFQCVAASSRPLRADELAEFLAFDFNVGSTPIFLADWRPEDPVHTVLSTCSSLLAVVDGVGGSPIIQFAHFSVKEYLTSARLAEEKDTISRFHVSMTPAHTIVAQACLGALLHLDENITKDNLDHFPLVEYAAEHWVGHTRFENVSSNVQDGMKRLFDPRQCHLSVWVWIYDPEEPRRRSERSQRPSLARATSLHYASFWGMYGIATFLIIERSQDVNARGFEKKETPLHVASRHGHMDVTQLLLRHGADTEVQDDDKCTPLLLASRREYVEVAHVLLEYGADREARDGYSCTPLLLASMRGYLEVARVLLKHGADKDAQDERGWSPLMHASKMGHVEVVRVLLKYGADMEARDMGGWTSLIHASRMGDVEIARVLLEQGADVKEQYKYRYTPLHYASSYGRLAVAQLLLKHGADVKARNAHNQTPLHEAKGEEVARLLIEHGADVDALDTHYRTPLHQASEDGITEVARVLLEHGVDPNARDADNATPLDHARRSGFWRSERRDVEQLMLHIGSLDLCTGKRGSDFNDESDSRKRPRQDAVAVDVRGGGSEDVIMTDEVGNVV
jgi:ankyrin repeat protein